MKTDKNLGIWMDHSTAHLIDPSKGEFIHQINSKFDFETKEEALSRSEHIMHNKRQQMQEAYYKEIAAEIVKYNQVMLFGPTNAAVELKNYVKRDKSFNEIKVEVKSSDKMTDNQKVAFVKEHFLG